MLSKYLYDKLREENAPVFDISTQLFDISKEYKCKGVSLGIISYHGLKEFYVVLPYFQRAAASDEWDVREFSQMFFRKLIKKHPGEARKYLLGQVVSEDPRIRRFVSETLRPVVENQWLFKDPEYSLGDLRRMFKESNPYPKTSVGNNLSDIARKNPELVYGVVEELIKSQNKHSYWIATRACRNLIKKEPIRVMDLLGIDEYRYKKRVHRRDDHI